VEIGAFELSLVAYTVFLCLERTTMREGGGGRIGHNNIGGIGWKSGPFWWYTVFFVLRTME
jgi:hypothetical protein